MENLDKKGDAGSSSGDRKKIEETIVSKRKPTSEMTNEEYAAAIKKVFDQMAPLGEEIADNSNR